MKNLGAALAAVVITFVGSTAFAAQCPYTFGKGDYFNDVAKGVTKQKTCAQGKALAEACAVGSSGDQIFVTPAFDKCAAAAKPHLDRTKKSALDTAYAKCDKANHKQGTMYISMNAFCHLDAIAKYAK